MKLYTEEQVRKAIDDARLYYDGWVMEEKEILFYLNTIELPSEEEIHNKGRYSSSINGFLEGGLWVIEQIKQQDK